MQPPPKHLIDVEQKYAPVWEAFRALAAKCHEAGGPLEEKTRRLVKLGIAIGFRHEGAVHSATRHALNAGLTRDEIMHAGILAVTTMGWPSAYAAMTWIEDVLSGAAGVAEGDETA